MFYQTRAPHSGFEKEACERSGAERGESQPITEQFQHQRNMKVAVCQAIKNSCFQNT